MPAEFDYYFDVASPATYLSWTQLPKLLEETGATIHYKPILLGGVFKETGNASPITVPAKGKWMFRDLKRWQKSYGVEFWMNDHFPINTLYLMRGLTAYQNDDRFVQLADAIFDGMWVSNKNVNEPEVIGEIVASTGIDPAEFLEKINDPATKQALIDTTAEAVSRGVFGAPTFFVGDNMHWGQDRMHFVKEDLLAE